MNNELINIINETAKERGLRVAVVPPREKNVIDEKYYSKKELERIRKIDNDIEAIRTVRSDEIAQLEAAVAPNVVDFAPQSVIGGSMIDPTSYNYQNLGPYCNIVQNAFDKVCGLCGMRPADIFIEVNPPLADVPSYIKMLYRIAPHCCAEAIYLFHRTAGTVSNPTSSLANFVQLYICTFQYSKGSSPPALELLPQLPIYAIFPYKLTKTRYSDYTNPPSSDVTYVTDDKEIPFFVAGKNIWADLVNTCSDWDWLRLKFWGFNDSYIDLSMEGVPVNERLSRLNECNSVMMPFILNLTDVLTYKLLARVASDFDCPKYTPEYCESQIQQIMATNYKTITLGLNVAQDRLP